MKKRFGDKDWEQYIPMPVDSEHPEYKELYKKAWELAYNHIKSIPDMPQSPYMDEAFCDTQIWIWDSCFMSLFCKYAPDVFPGVETLNNFYEVLYNGKNLASVSVTAEEPYWTGYTEGEKAPIHIHLADNPPLFAFAEYENARLSGDVAHVRELLYTKQYLQKHYEWFEGLKESVIPNNVSHCTCLISEDCGYKWEGGRSGMDNTPRGRVGAKATKERPNNPNMLWLDAICQQALSAKCIAKLFELLGDKEQGAVWNEKFLEKKAIVNRLYWSKEDAFYYDIDCYTHEFYKVMTPASFWALTAGIADKEQALQLATHTQNPDTLGGIIPLTSVARNDADFVASGGYWRGAVWMPTTYASLKGLAEYGMYDIARTIAKKTLRHLYNTYAQFEPHTIWESYSPEKCEPATTTDNTTLVRKDFCGWSALGPICIYIEYLLGFHTIDAFEKKVYWEKPQTVGEIGIRNLRFGEIVTDIVANGRECTVVSNAPYTLLICDKPFEINVGKQKILLV